jgi:hypothetical protein
LHKFARKRQGKMRNGLQGGKEIVHKKKTPIIDYNPYLMHGEN